MRVTVCQLRDDPVGMERDWADLASHVSKHGSHLVLLPEMPFHPWPCLAPAFDDDEWRAACEAHDRWMGRLADLAPAAVLGTRPAVDDAVPGRAGRHNEAFVWDAPSGVRAVHRKVYLPNEDGFWEASWYAPGDGSFDTFQFAGLTVGFLVCTELWFLDRARRYARHDVDVIAVPRATPSASAETWLVGGRAAAIVGGAYCLSSNRGGPYGTPSGGVGESVPPESKTGPAGAARASRAASAVSWAGVGWVTEPEAGRLVGTTHETARFLTVEIDPARARAAKRTYPRNVQA